jgi:hypothetical protein
MESMIDRLKEMLRIGIENAVRLIARAGGCFRRRIAIPLPRELEYPADALRAIGMGRQVDELVATMNRAAEKAAPKAIGIFIDAVGRLTLPDALAILQGPDAAATAYFKERTRDALYKAFRPIVAETLDEAGVIALYQNILMAYTP